MLSRRDPNGFPVGLEELSALAANSATLPITRLYLAFVSPTMLYIPGMSNLQYAGIGASDSGDFGFSSIKDSVSKLQAGGVEVFLSMGG